MKVLVMSEETGRSVMAALHDGLEEGCVNLPMTEVEIPDGCTLAVVGHTPMRECPACHGAVRNPDGTSCHRCDKTGLIGGQLEVVREVNL